MEPAKPKIIAIVGPNASGKSDLAVRLAKQFNGEIISADSRQVYRGFNIGSGKITKKEMAGVPHHLLDVASPKQNYDVIRYKRDAKKALRQILKKGKVPIIAGGTGFYIDALINDVSLPEVKANQKLRKELEKLSTEDLFKKIQKLDQDRAKELDPNNKVRLIRAIEIAKALGKVPKVKNNSPYDVLWIGLKLDEKTQRKNIHIRLFARIREIIKEVKKLQKSGLSWKRLEGFGLEYRYGAQYLQGKIDKEEMIKRINVDSWRYAKRQMRWFKHNKKINWLSPNDKKMLELVKKFKLNT